MMKELLQSKPILLFITIILGAILIGGETNQLEEAKLYDDYISYNLN